MTVGWAAWSDPAVGVGVAVAGVVGVTAWVGCAAWLDRGAAGAGCEEHPARPSAASSTETVTSARERTTWRIDPFSRARTRRRRALRSPIADTQPRQWQPSTPGSPNADLPLSDLKPP